MTTTYKIAIGTVLVERRESDYIAMIADRKSQWGNGRSPREAIGDLVITHFSVGV